MSAHLDMAVVGKEQNKMLIFVQINWQEKELIKQTKVISHNLYNFDVVKHRLDY